MRWGACGPPNPLDAQDLVRPRDGLEDLEHVGDRPHADALGDPEVSCAGPAHQDLRARPLQVLQVVAGRGIRQGQLNPRLVAGFLIGGPVARRLIIGKNLNAATEKTTPGAK